MKKKKLSDKKTLTFAEYQTRAFTTALPNARTAEYMVLGLCSEAGEVAGKLKKKIRDGVFDRDAVLDEIGDVLWYVAGLCTVLDAELLDVAEGNLAKLKSRAERNVLRGSGDVR